MEQGHDELARLLATWRDTELGDAADHDRAGALPDDVWTAATAVGLDDVAADRGAVRVAARAIGPAGLGHVLTLVVAPHAASVVAAPATAALVLGGVALVTDRADRAVHVQDGSVTGLATADPGPGWLGLRVTAPRGAASAGGDGAHPELGSVVDALLLDGLTGLARHLADLAARHTRDREAFGRPLRGFQVVAHHLVDLEADVAAITTLADVDDPTTSRRRLHAALHHAWTLVDGVLQLHGGMGYAEELEVARHWRDIRMLRLLVGPARGTIAASAELDRSPTPWPRRDDRHELASLRERARAFVTARILPHVTDWELAGEWPRELVAEVGEAGFLRLRFPETVGGSGGGMEAQAVWIEELARCGAAGLAADLGASVDLAAVYVHAAGTPEQHDRWLRPLLRGEAIGALAITEPGTGSDVAGITTRARRDGDGWVLDGAKVFITNGPWADVVVVAAKVGEDDGGGATPHGQVTLFAVPGDADGVSRRRLSMLGWRTSHTGELTFDDVRLPADALLGDVGSGFGWIVRNFAWERLTLALAAIAAAEFAMDTVPDALRDARWDELDTAVLAGRTITDAALGRTLAAPDDPDTLRAVAIAKLRTQRVAVDAADLALTHAGPVGGRLDHPAQRWLRDARLGPIGGGTDAIMREIVAKLIG